MKTYFQFQHFHSESKTWLAISRFLFLTGMVIWVGGLVYFPVGVASVPFKIAQEWKLSGVNPDLPSQPINYRTIGGEITSRSLQRLNLLELIGLSCAATGLLFLWLTHRYRTLPLIFQTLLLAAMAILYLIYVYGIGERMFFIQNNVPIDFSIQELSLQQAEHREFQQLHQQYSKLVSVNAVLGVLQILLFSIYPLGTVTKSN